MKLSFPNINYESLFRNYLELLLATIIFTSTTRYLLLPRPCFSLFLLSRPWFTFTLLSKPFYLLPKPIFISTTLFLVLQPFHFFTFRNIFLFLNFFLTSTFKILSMDQSDFGNIWADIGTWTVVTKTRNQK